MKCNNCKISIDKTFSYAIKNNLCPACGNNIMAPEKLAAFMSLQELIKENFPDINAEKVSNLIVANFELKQLFKESSVEVEEPKDIEVNKEEMSDEEYDREYKAKQMEEARKLKAMRESVFEDALRGQFGMEVDEEEIEIINPDLDAFIGEGDELDPAELANRMKQSQKQSISKSKMLSGSGGFTRSK